jgi:hypothetical protein
LSTEKFGAGVFDVRSWLHLFSAQILSVGNRVLFILRRPSEFKPRAKYPVGMYMAVSEDVLDRRSHANQQVACEGALPFLIRPSFPSG